MTSGCPAQYVALQLAAEGSLRQTAMGEKEEAEGRALLVTTGTLTLFPRRGCNPRVVQSLCVLFAKVD